MSPDVAVSHATNTVSTSDWGNTVLKLFFYDGWQCVEETNTLGVVQKKYVFGEGIDEVVKATLPDVNDIDGDLSTTDQVDVYYHHNSLGSVVAVTNGSGTIAEEYTYTAYGEVSVDTKLGNTQGVSGTTQIAQPFMFTGRRWDYEEASGLYYYRLRQYDPVAGRFVSRDPLGLWGDPGQRGNAQSYCSNNPVNFVDPFGLDDVDLTKSFPWPVGTKFEIDGPGPYNGEGELLGISKTWIELRLKAEVGGKKFDLIVEVVYTGEKKGTLRFWPYRKDQAPNAPDPTKGPLSEPQDPKPDGTESDPKPDESTAEPKPEKGPRPRVLWRWGGIVFAPKAYEVTIIQVGDMIVVSGLFKKQRCTAVLKPEPDDDEELDLDVDVSGDKYDFDLEKDE